MKQALDMSSVIWSCLSVGKDREGYEALDEDGKTHWVNTQAYGYENAVNYIVSSLKRFNLTPKDAILVFEGQSSKVMRGMISKEYKAGRGKRPNEAYVEFNNLKEQLQSVFSKLGALSVTQDYVEGDDILGWLAENTEEDLVIRSGDGDLAALAGENKYGAMVMTYIGDKLINENPFGPFLNKHITVYKALVGDSSDNIKGIKGFGPAAFGEFYRGYGEDGLAELARLAEIGSMDELAPECGEKVVKKIFDGSDEFILSWRLAKIHTEWVNTLAHPLQFTPGLIRGTTGDERLKRWEAKCRLVTSTNFDAAMDYLKTQTAATPFFSLDLETSTPQESDDWLSQNGREKKVDVISSKITGGSITFGANTNVTYYITVDHVDSDNCTIEQFGQMLQALGGDKLTVAHNAAGFELPVLFNEFGEAWKDNGWRGMFPNMVDSRIAASFWDENRMSFGLKQLSKDLFNYDQETYDEVTGGLKMNQVPASKVLNYGCDDTIVAAGLWNFFQTFMRLDHTYQAFLNLEQKPMYLQALAYTQGVPIDMRRLTELATNDRERALVLQGTIDEFLIARGWEGTVLPVYEEITAAAIKDAVALLGTELKTAVRTPAKLAPMIRELPVEGAAILAAIVEATDVIAFNKFFATRWTARPELNTGSPLQLQKLLYETLGLPVRLRNKATDTMRAKGIREGNARTDEDAMMMAIKQGDAVGENADVLKALVEVKSIRTRQGLYWEAYPKFLHHETGRIHPSLRQSSTNTRRYTGAEPNLQQMDSDPNGVRSVLLPHRRNAIIASLDESAQEVRQMADYCKDANLLTCYLGTADQLRDVHSIVACKIAGCSYEEFRRRLKKGTDEEQVAANKQRQAAKITLFATLYGASAPKIAEGLGITEEEAQGYIDAIYDQFPDAKQWKDQTEQMATDQGWVPIHGGSKRHLQSLVTSSDRYTASKALRQAGNARIQAAGGNQLKRIMGRIWDSNLLDDYDYRWYFSVHDETIHSIGKDCAVEVLEILHGFMCEQFLDIVPSASSIGVGRNFGNLAEQGEVFDKATLQAAVDGLFL